MSYDRQYQGLEQLRSELMEKLSGLDSATLNRAPASGGWSASQVVAHVVSAESRSLVYLKKKTLNPSAIPASGLGAAVKSGLLALVLKSRIKVLAPPGGGDVPDRAELADLDREWRSVRADWQSFLAEFPEELADRAVYKHPVAGRLNLSQALRFLSDHLRRHSGQIERCLADAATSATTSE